MKTYIATLTGGRQVTVEAESESAVRQCWIDGVEPFDYEAFPSERILSIREAEGVQS